MLPDSVGEDVPNIKAAIGGNKSGKLYVRGLKQHTMWNITLCILGRKWDNVLFVWCRSVCKSLLFTQ